MEDTEQLQRRIQSRTRLNFPFTPSVFTYIDPNHVQHSRNRISETTCPLPQCSAPRRKLDSFHRRRADNAAFVADCFFRPASVWTLQGRNRSPRRLQRAAVRRTIGLLCRPPVLEVSCRAVQMNCTNNCTSIIKRPLFQSSLPLQERLQTVDPRVEIDLVSNNLQEHIQWALNN